MIAVTGAGGKTGLAVIRALAQRGQKVRSLVRDRAGQEKLAAAGAVQSVVGDMADAATLQDLLEGAHAVYHICPNMHPDEFAIGVTLLACAKAAGIEHFVYHSVLHPQTEAMPHHWQKMLVEDRVFASGLPFTILQPTAYMQNLSAYWPAIRQTGRFAVPYPVNTRLSLVDVRDVAEAASRVLIAPEAHRGASYELVGSAPLTQLEVAALIESALGRRVKAEELALEAWEQQARAGNLHPYAVESLLKMFRYYAAYGLVGNANVLRWLLGREPASLESYIREMAEG
jgi:uncharacterized protein YbjT (DUF2867 family)